MNRAEHVAGGLPVAIASAAIAARNQPLPFFVVESVVGGTLGGMLGIVLPDVFEPATSPNHRGVAHAVLPMTVVGLALWKVAGNCQERLRAKAEEFRWHAANEPNDFLRFIYSIAEFVLRALSGAIAAVIGGYPKPDGGFLLREPKLRPPLAQVLPDGLRFPRYLGRPWSLKKERNPGP